MCPKLIWPWVHITRVDIIVVIEQTGNVGVVGVVVVNLKGERGLQADFQARIVT